MSDKTPTPQANNPLHGITLATIVTQLHEHYGWEGLAKRIDIRCFKSDPSIKSSLKFLRKTPWARSKVETLYLRTKFKKAASATKSPSQPKKNTPKKLSEPLSNKAEQVAATTLAAEIEEPCANPANPTAAISPSAATTPSQEPAKPSSAGKAKRSFTGGNATSNKRSF